MKQKYTFLSLLTAVSKGQQPDPVVYRKKSFFWDPAAKTYKDEKGKDITAYMANYTGGSLCSVEMISADVSILTEKEHDWLKNLIAPIRKRVRHIAKKPTTGGCDFLEICFDEIPEFSPNPDKDPGFLETWAFKRGTAFSGMQPGFLYDPEDLEL